MARSASLVLFVVLSLLLVGTSGRDCLYALGDDYNGDTYIGVIEASTGQVEMLYPVSPSFTSDWMFTALDVARGRFYVVSVGLDNGQQIQLLTAMDARTGGVIFSVLTDVGFNNRIQQLALDPSTGNLYGVTGPLEGGLSVVQLNTSNGDKSALPISIPSSWEVEPLNVQASGLVFDGQLVLFFTASNNDGVVASIDLREMTMNSWTTPHVVLQQPAVATSPSSYSLLGYVSPNGNDAYLTTVNCGLFGCNEQTLGSLPPSLQPTTNGGGSSTTYYWADWYFHTAPQNLWAYSIANASIHSSVPVVGWPQASCVVNWVNVFSSSASNCSAAIGAVLD